MKVCGECGALNGDDLRRCGACGHQLAASDLRDEKPLDAAWMEREPAKGSILSGLREDASMANTGGLLILISGVIVCLIGLSTVLGGAIIEGVLGIDVDSGYVVLGIAVIIVGALISLAGRDAMRRRGWKWAVASCIIIMLFGQVLLALGTAALVLVAVSRPDFID